MEFGGPTGKGSLSRRQGLAELPFLPLSWDVALIQYSVPDTDIMILDVDIEAKHQALGLFSRQCTQVACARLIPLG